VRSCWLAGRINRNLPKVGQCRRWRGSLCKVVKVRMGWKYFSASSPSFHKGSAPRNLLTGSFWIKRYFSFCLFDVCDC
jgi:hypothetical protein